MNQKELDSMLESINNIISEELKPLGYKTSKIELYGSCTGVKGDVGLNGWTVCFGAEGSNKLCIRDLDWTILRKIEHRIVGEFKEITRVLYSISRMEDEDINS